MSMRPTSGALLSLLLLSAVLALLPIAPALGSTGHPVLGTVNAVPTPSSFTGAVTSVTVPAGSMNVTKVDGVLVIPSTHLLTIIFNGVTFSGSQFYLYLSQDGFASQSAGDVKYSPAFGVSDFAANVGTLKAVSNVNGTFYIGTYSGNEVVVGPIPVSVSSSYKFIKVFDGDTGAEAVTTQQVIIIPGSLMVSTTTVTTTTKTTTTTTESTTITQSVTQTVTTAQPTTITQSVTQTVTTAQPTTITQSVTQTVTTAQPTTTTVKTTTTTTSLSTSTSASTFAYMALAAAVIVILLVATLAIWALRGRRSQ